MDVYGIFLFSVTRFHCHSDASSISAPICGKTILTLVSNFHDLKYFPLFRKTPGVFPYMGYITTTLVSNVGKNCPFLPVQCWGKNSSPLIALVSPTLNGGVGEISKTMRPRLYVDGVSLLLLLGFS